MDLSELAHGACQPKETNRQSGYLFEKWSTEDACFEALSPDEFGNKPMHHTDDPEIMDGSGAEKKRFVKEELGISLSKEPDALIRIRTMSREPVYIIVEAKYAGSNGGNQKKNVEDAREVAEEVNSSDSKAIGVGVVDGDPLMEKRSKKGTKPQRIFRQAEQPMMSALLLEEFVESIRKDGY